MKVNFKDMAASVQAAAFAVGRAAQTCAWAAGSTVRAVVVITANVCTEVGGLKAIVGLVGALIGLKGVWGGDVSNLATLSTTCETANKTFSAIHITGPLSDIVSGKADTAEFRDNKVLYLAARVAFLTKDIVTVTKFAESLGVIAAGTAKAAFSKFSNATGIAITADGFCDTLEYAGWATELTRHIVDWGKDWNAANARGGGFVSTLSSKRVFELIFDLGKLGAIIMKNRLGKITETIKFCSLLAQSATAFGRQTKNYFYPERRAV